MNILTYSDIFDYPDNAIFAKCIRKTQDKESLYSKCVIKIQLYYRMYSPPQNIVDSIFSGKSFISTPKTFHFYHQVF